MAIELISKIKPKNGGDFAMVDSEDVEIDSSNRRLSDVLTSDIDTQTVAATRLLTQEQYTTLISEGEIITEHGVVLYDPGTVYLIYEPDETEAET